MSDSSKPTGDLFNELFALGNNVTRLMRAAWDSPERKKMQGELNRVRERIRTGGLEAAAYEEMTAILQRINGELSKASEKMKGGDTPAE